jgi:hypothetical protein
MLDTSRHAARSVIALAALAGVAACASVARHASSRTTSHTTSHRSASPTRPAALASDDSCSEAGPAATLELRSSFWVNLHDFLLEESKRRRGVVDGAPGAFRVLADDTTGTRALTDRERTQWSAALDAYDRALREAREMDSALVFLNVRLAAAADSGDLPDVTVAPVLPVALGAALRAAAPTYRAVWWPAHDRRNREWIAAMRTQLDVRGACLFRREAALFRRPWPAALPVEASVYASWFGAYTTLDPIQITVSSAAVGTQGTGGLEVLLHESGHAILGAVDSALAASAARRRRQLPSELSHLLLFYAAGELVRGSAAAHVPFAEAYGIWRQNDAARRYRQLLERAWRPYLDGRTDFASAIDALVRGLDPAAS